ncbi:MAG TPA: bacterial proteasome activator family protein [Beutenbergiaceae bacterium]|nr:bacterial proteasome activator family protein [Beutenbergiaceae bacterium]
MSTEQPTPAQGEPPEEEIAVDGSDDSDTDTDADRETTKAGKPADAQEGDGPKSQPKIVVTSPQSLAVAEADDEDNDPTAAISEPAKVMRLGAMIKQLLEEVRSAPLDEAARERLAKIHDRSLHELESGLSEELVDELGRITLPFSESSTPSDAELRIAKAQLVGWLEGLFHGIQTALVAQQMAAQNQLAQMRKGLPPGAAPQGQMPPGLMVNRPDEDGPGPGQYL